MTKSEANLEFHFLFISHNTIMLEAPSEKSKQRAARDVNDKIQQGHDNLTAIKKTFSWRRRKGEEEKEEWT